MRIRLSLAILLPVVLLLSVAVKPLPAQGRETATVTNASAVLDELMRVPAKGIPRALLSKAEGIVIIPNMLKGGFVLGVRRGRGVALTRNARTAIADDRR